MNVDSENNNLKVENVNFVKMKKITFWQKIIILFFLCFSSLMFFIYALFTKNNIIIANKSSVDELVNICKYYIKEILKSGDNKILLPNLSIYSDNIHDKLKILRLLTNNNIYYYEDYEKCLLNNPDSQKCIYHLIAPKKVIGKERILIGDKEDGSYVLLNDFKNIRVAYSFGIQKLVQFDKGLADRGIDVYMYDHTIDSLPYNNPKFHWEKIGIAGKNNVNNQLKTLEQLMIKNGHSSETNMILKMDIENNEWDSLKDVPENVLKQFKYIVIEYHFETNNVQLYYNVLNKIYKNHQAFYLRCHGREIITKFGFNRICKYLEASYIIREGNLFEKDDSIYPIYEFDFHNPKENAYSDMNLNILKLFSS